MNIKHFSGKEPIVYVSPAIKELSLCFEGGGILCGSFDGDNYTEIFDREDMEDL